MQETGSLLLRAAQEFCSPEVLWARRQLHLQGSAQRYLGELPVLVRGLREAGVASGCGYGGSGWGLGDGLLLLPGLPEGVVHIGVVIDKGVRIGAGAVLLTLSAL